MRPALICGVFACALASTITSQMKFLQGTCQAGYQMENGVCVKVCVDSSVGNSICDPECNNENYNNDGGDCVPCEPGYERFGKCISTAQTAQFSQYYNEKDADHFYTASDSDRKTALALGYKFEMNIGRIFLTQAPQTVPLHRFYNSVTKDHFYAVAEYDQNRAKELGYTYEGIAGYIFPEPLPRLLPLMRLYNSKVNDHFYTTFPEHSENAKKTYNYVSEGITGYLLPS